MQARELMHMPAWDSTAYSVSGFGQSLYEDTRLAESKYDHATFRSAKGGSGRPEPGEMTLDESIKKEGVKEPVEVRAPMQVTSKSTGATINYPEILRDGHHRVVSAFVHNPDSWIPIKYS